MKSNHMIVVALLAGTALGGLGVESLHGQTKPPVYLISEINVTDLDGYMKEFVPKVRVTIKAAGGRQLGASQNVIPIEGDPPKARVTIIAWDSMEQLQAWRNSPEYKEARKIGG
jgi:uncharacterized protein (DUF1330 family)